MAAIRATRNSKFVGSLLKGHLQQGNPYHPHGKQDALASLNNNDKGPYRNLPGPALPFGDMKGQIRMLDQRIYQIDTRNQRAATDYDPNSVGGNARASTMTRTIVTLKNSSRDPEAAKRDQQTGATDSWVTLNQRIEN